MIIVEGWVRLASDDIERLRDVAFEMTRASRLEPGCEQYAYSIDLFDPTILRVSERWTDEASLEAHFATPHMADFNATLARADVESASVKAYSAQYVRTLLGRD